MPHRYWTTPRSTYARTTYPIRRTYYTPHTTSYAYYSTTSNPVYQDAPYTQTPSPVVRYTQNTASNFITSKDQSNLGYYYNYNNNNNLNNSINDDSGSVTTKKAYNNYHSYMNHNIYYPSKTSISPNDVNYSKNTPYKYKSLMSTTVSSRNRYDSQSNNYGKTFFSDPM